MKAIARACLRISDLLESTAHKIRGAAQRVAPESALTFGDCERQNWENVRPCFVLSTGRTGTLLLNNLLNLADNCMALHAPTPELIRASKRAYEEVHAVPQVFEEVLKSAREDYILHAARRSRIYVETNNRVTFFAPVIPTVFPKAVFIHLVRHPADFVRSGVRRKWYSGQHEHDVGRITPVSGPMKDEWQDLPLVGKIAWLWNETNEFIEKFKESIAPESVLVVRSEELFGDTAVAQHIFSFLGLQGCSQGAVAKQIAKPANVQKKGDFPRYDHWSEHDIAALKKQATLAPAYGYTL